MPGPPGCKPVMLPPRLEAWGNRAPTNPRPVRSAPAYEPLDEPPPQPPSAPASAEPFSFPSEDTPATTGGPPPLECADRSALLDEATCRLVQKRRLAAALPKRALQASWAQYAKNFRGVFSPEEQAAMRAILTHTAALEFIGLEGWILNFPWTLNFELSPPRLLPPFPPCPTELQRRRISRFPAFRFGFLSSQVAPGKIPPGPTRSPAIGGCHCSSR